MFVPHDDWPPPPRWEPPRPEPPRRGPPRMSARDERVLLWLVGANLFLLFLLPIAGGSVLQLVWAVFGG